MIVGILLGDTDGVVGIKVGRQVGIPDGTLVGLEDGMRLGVRVGVYENPGDSVGTAVVGL